LTNWDDQFYVIKNALLVGPDWKGIFTTPVVSNYHPLTIITLAINYQMGQLDPTSYMWFNLLLHVANVLLVFYFSWLISERKSWVGFLTALIFAIHPLHVESVAWVSERKDVLYTFFFLLSLIQYWKYLETGKSTKLWWCFVLFALSLLSKPAAIVLPLVLLLLDYWKGRSFSGKIFTEKIIFFLAALIMAIVTVSIQSKNAIAGLELYPLWTRPLFASYAVMTYFIRFFVPYPLSAFHPYPPVQNLGWAIYISPLFIACLAALLWFKRKNKILVFGFLFLIVNLLLVMQIVAIGTTIVSERYTYVPYIGLSFILSMLLMRLKNNRIILPVVSAAAAVIFGFITFQRTKVWKSSDTLWSNVIDQYPEAPIPRTNRAEYYVALSGDPAYSNQRDSLLKTALDDCNTAIKITPNHQKGYENRGVIYLTIGKIDEALADAETLKRIAPQNIYAYTIAGTAHIRMSQPGKALDDFTKALSISPNDDFSLNKKGSLLSSFYGKHNEAIADFTRAIEINPQADYYFNRSQSYRAMGNLLQAKADAQAAIERGKVVDEGYKKSVGL
jgi:Tfp pilus assembly protein PilF